MFRFSQIGSRFLSYWSYKGEILHWNFWPLSLHYSLIVPTCWYPKTLHIPFWTMKQTNSLSMCRMNFDTTTCFFLMFPIIPELVFQRKTFCWTFCDHFCFLEWIPRDYFVIFFSIGFQSEPNVLKFILHPVLNGNLPFWYNSFSLFLVLQNSFTHFQKRNKPKYHHKIAIRFLLHKQLPE